MYLTEMYIKIIIYAHSADTLSDCVVDDNSIEIAACQTVRLQSTVVRTFPGGISPMFPFHSDNKS